jgi:hypothetical protein
MRSFRRRMSGRVRVCVSPLRVCLSTFREKPHLLSSCVAPHFETDKINIFLVNFGAGTP